MAYIAINGNTDAMTAEEKAVYAIDIRTVEEAVARARRSEECQCADRAKQLRQGFEDAVYCLDDWVQQLSTPHLTFLAMLSDELHAHLEQELANREGGDHAD